MNGAIEQSHGWPFLVRVLAGAFSRKHSVLVAQHRPWFHSVLTSLVFVILAVAPLSYLVARAIKSIEVISYEPGLLERPSWPEALSWAFAVLAGPYLLWVALVYGLHRLLVRSDATRRPGALCEAAAGLVLAYLACWCLPVSWPCVFLGSVEGYLLPAAFRDPFYRGLYHTIYYGTPIISAVFGLVLLVVGVRNNIRILRGIPGRSASKCIE